MEDIDKIPDYSKHGTLEMVKVFAIQSIEFNRTTLPNEDIPVSKTFLYCGKKYRITVFNCKILKFEEIEK